MNESQLQFTERLLKNAKAELLLAIQYKNSEREDYLRARIRSYEKLLEENNDCTSY